MTTSANDETTTSGAPKSGGSHRWRGLASTILLVLGAVLLPVSVLTVWVHNVVLDTERYVETVSPLASDPAVKAALTKRISEKVSAQLDLESLAEEVLPERAKVLAPAIAAGADELIERQTERLVASPRFAQAWVAANRFGHAGLAVAITGRDGDVVATSNGQVVLKLEGLAEEVLAEVDKRFDIDLAARAPTERIDVEFVLVDAPALEQAQAAVRLLDRLAVALPVLTIVTLAASVLVGTDRRRRVQRVGLAIATSMLVLLGVVAVGRGWYLDRLPAGGEGLPAAAAVIDTLTRFMLAWVRSAAVVGLVVGFVAWVFGPNRLAEHLRSLVKRPGGAGGGENSAPATTAGT